MATDGQMPLGPGSNLDVLRQRAQKAAEFYQQHQDFSSGDQPEDGKPSGRDYRVTTQYSDNYSGKYIGAQCNSEGGRGSGGGSGRLGTNINRVLSDDSFDASVASASSSSFYRGKSRAGIIDMRSSYNERISSTGGGGKARNFHSSHLDSRSRTQAYGVDSNQPQPTKQQKNPISQQYGQQQAAPQKPARTYTTNRAMLYRSSSDLEMESGEVDTPPPAPAILHREYGSTSSLDVLGTSSENFFSMLSEFRHHAQDQRSPAPPRLQELLQGRLESSSEPHIQAATESARGSVRFMNGLASNDKDLSGDDIDSSKSNKNKSKHKERKQRAKSITGEGSASILKKLRGKIDSDLASAKSEDRVVVTEDLSLRNEEHSRRRAFVHFDCQSVGVDLNKVIYHRVHSASHKSNITTGASAASGQRASLAPDKEDPDILADTDEGDGKSNELVLSCPFFRNELGGEDERTVSLTKVTAQKRVAGSYPSPVSSAAGYRTQVSIIFVLT